ncbi:hypothetical protein LTR08_004773 [Meristemomyces frigidus]|nr:hypothetical protein LTR08_004773 [Meristemomyces frigidus]
MEPTVGARGKRPDIRELASTTATSTESTSASQYSATAVPSKSNRAPRPINAPARSSKPAYICRATQTTPRPDLLLPREPVSFDAEFQTYRPSGSPKWIQRLGRSTLRNTRGQTVLDVYCYYPTIAGELKDVPPRRFNVCRADLMKQHGARPAQMVEKWIAELVEGRTVVVHDYRGDLSALQYETHAFDDCNIVDTQVLYGHLQGNGRPGLALCAAMELGITIQVDSHSPVEDADTAMRLFQKRFPDAFDPEAAEAQACEEQRAAEITQVADLVLRAASGRNRDGGNHYPHNNHQANVFGDSGAGNSTTQLARKDDRERSGFGCGDLGEGGRYYPLTPVPACKA